MQRVAPTVDKVEWVTRLDQQIPVQGAAAVIGMSLPAFPTCTATRSLTLAMSLVMPLVMPLVTPLATIAKGRAAGGQAVATSRTPRVAEAELATAEGRTNGKAA